MKINISNDNQIKNIKAEIGQLKKEIKSLWIFWISFQIMLLSMFYIMGESIDQLVIVSNMLLDTWILLYTIASTFISGYEIFKLKRKIANLQKNKVDITNKFDKNDTGKTSTAVYMNKLSKSKSDGNKVDEESKRRVFNQNSNVIINSSQPTNTNSKKRGNVEIKNKKLEFNDGTSNTTQVALGVALSLATTTSVFQNDTNTSLGCDPSSDGGGDCGGF